MAELSRQDVQQVIDNAKNRIIERLATRQEVQNITDTARDRVMNYVHDLMMVHQQNIFRRSNVQNADLVRRISVLENRLMNIEQDLKVTLQILQRVASQGKQQIIMPVMPEYNGKYSPEQRYAYRLE